jgi:hypothetical protein
MALHAATHTIEDIRMILNAVVDVSDEVWIREDLPAPHSSRRKP